MKSSVSSFQSVISLLTQPVSQTVKNRQANKDHSNPVTAVSVYSVTQSHIPSAHRCLGVHSAVPAGLRTWGSWGLGPRPRAGGGRLSQPALESPLQCGGFFESGAMTAEGKRMRGMFVLHLPPRAQLCGLSFSQNAGTLRPNHSSSSQQPLSAAGARASVSRPQEEGPPQVLVSLCSRVSSMGKYHI